MSVEEVQDGVPENHSLMHPNTTSDAANGGVELKMVDNDSEAVAPHEGVDDNMPHVPEPVETVEEELCE